MAIIFLFIAIFLLPPVKAGDTVKTKQSIGQIFSDGTDNGRTVLHFQLRREKEKLNPEPWLNR